jgi:hypothetical protein
VGRAGAAARPIRRAELVVSARVIHAHPLEPVERDGWLRVAARIEGLEDAPDTLWFDLEPRHREHLPEEADPFLLALLYPAIGARAALHVHGAVSRELLQNLEWFQIVWRTWRPARYEPIDLEADRETPAATRVDRSIAMFSGGLDSAFTVYRHRRGLLGRRSPPLNAALMVLGFDIPLEDEDQFPAVVDRSRRMLDGIGLDLWTMRTNFRRFRANWEDAHATALAACLHCYAAGHGTGLIPASTYAGTATEPDAWGSNDITDPLMSSGRMRIVHEAGEIQRHLKTRLVSEWPEAMKELRVCYVSPARDRNCGKCSKCVLTKLSFMAQGLPIPASLEPAPTEEEILRLRFKPGWEAAYVRLLIDLGRRNGTRPPFWARSLERGLLRSGSTWQKILSRLPYPG